MTRFFAVFVFSAFFMTLSSFVQAEAPWSVETEECLGCHASLHPGIVEGWKKSRHAQVTPAQALSVEGLGLKVSSPDVPEDLREHAVGCAECHLLRPEEHAGTFEHNGYQVHTVVSPADCATCHSQEAEQYSKNIMSYGHVNFVGNPLYIQLENTILGTPALDGETVRFPPPNMETREEGCLYCHGTELKVEGVRTRDTLYGEMDFPVISGWPNQGVGRINLDKSRGSCAACHTRHEFSMAMARQPYTCKECHVGPDVPVYQVYTASKHGNIFVSLKDKMNFTDVPWVIGEDITTPTCATCHISLMVNTDGEVVAERTHTMSDRLSWRIFGLIYAHPQPKSPDTTIIRSKDGLPLPTALDGTFADEYLIDDATMTAHRKKMEAVCLTCHDTSWVEGNFRRYENAIVTTNAMVLETTRQMTEAWEKGYASGPSRNGLPFDEAVERRWMDGWLFYANTARFASAMAGGGDYGVFANGRYEMTKVAADLQQWLNIQDMLHRK